MKRSFLAVLTAVPTLLSVTVAIGAESAPQSVTTDLRLAETRATHSREATTSVALEYRLADETGHIVASGTTILSKRRPLEMGTSFVRVSYIASCSPDSGIVTNDPKCTVETSDIGNTLKIALADVQPGVITLAAWVDWQTLDGMQTIQNDGFATQRPLSHGWSDSKATTIVPGHSTIIQLRNHFSLTLKASMLND
ncbi:hypothetical protein LFL96_36925 (plasmid) [Paraburkholderia sp. D15]|uniref:hypothetical protein n=1 Tax=Paraburkholderia sp. D15 TaxID=2880218 RepID=UPI0024790989|nr:hypothetical protein [Paraburkholderia sp. D15]WGS55063.1 hypothetical protein LFL96_36925 [Paraburkholderia sp. D15]